MTKTMTRLAMLTMTVALALASVPQPATAASGAEIEEKASAALEQLYETTEAAKKLSSEATGILVFPSIGKGGFVLAGWCGETPCEEEVQGSLKVTIRCIPISGDLAEPFSGDCVACGKPAKADQPRVIWAKAY